MKRIERYFILGDPHMTEGESLLWGEVIDDINRQEPDAVLVLGDLTGNPGIGSEPVLRHATGLLDRLKAPWFSIIGNHDLEHRGFSSDEEAVAMMLKVFGRSTPGFRHDFPSLTVLGLSNTRWRTNPVNKNEIVITPEEIAWWEGELATLSPDRPVLMLCHAPVLGSGVVVLPEHHVRVGNAYVNQNHNPGRLQQTIWEHPNLLFWFSGHSHLGQHYRDAISRRTGVLYAHAATASARSSRDGHRQSRVLDITAEGFRLRTFDHGLRRYLPELEFAENRPLAELIAARERYRGRLVIPRNAETMDQPALSHLPSNARARRFVFLSDAHVVETISPAQQRLIEWTKREIHQLQPERVILGGDLTHHASPDQAVTFLNRLGLLSYPLDYLVGNNEGANFSLPEGSWTGVHVVSGCEGQGPGVYYLETPNTEIATRAAAAFLQQDDGTQPCLVFAHFPPELTGDDVVERLSRRAAPIHWVCGHRHRAGTSVNGSLTVHIAGGLDPVKVRGHLPEWLVIDWDQNTPSIRRVTVPAAITLPDRPRRFPLGVAYFGTPADLLRTGLEYQITGLQFRAPKGDPSEEELALAQEYRLRIENSFLSQHLPNFSNPTECLRAEEMRPFLQWAFAIGIDDLTIHLPKVPTRLLYERDGSFADTPWAKHCLAVYTDLARQAIANGAQLSVENVYNKDKPEEPDEILSTRPWHLTTLIDRLRENLRASGLAEKEVRKVGMIFDVGHAFRDAKVAKIHGLADWVARTGAHLHLSHIHQVVADGHARKNHRGISDIFGPFINYHGYLGILDEGVPKPFPLLIEVRDRQEALTSLATLRAWYDSPNGYA